MTSPRLLLLIWILLAVNGTAQLSQEELNRVASFRKSLSSFVSIATGRGQSIDRGYWMSVLALPDSKLNEMMQVRLEQLFGQAYHATGSAQLSESDLAIVDSCRSSYYYNLVRILESDKPVDISYLIDLNLQMTASNQQILAKVKNLALP